MYINSSTYGADMGRVTSARIDRFEKGRKGEIGRDKTMEQFQQRCLSLHKVCAPSSRVSRDVLAGGLLGFLPVPTLIFGWLNLSLAPCPPHAMQLTYIIADDVEVGSYAEATQFSCDCKNFWHSVLCKHVLFFKHQLKLIDLEKLVRRLLFLSRARARSRSLSPKYSLTPTPSPLADRSR